MTQPATTEPRLIRPLLNRLAAHGWRTVLAALLCAATASLHAAELKVIAPNAVKEAVVEIASHFEKTTGHRVQLLWGGSEAIAKRVADGEVFDVVINTAPGVERMGASGKLERKSQMDFAKSAVAVAIRPGVPRPDISTVDGVRTALLNASSVAISSGASGRYLEQLFEKLGVADKIRHKIRQPPSGAQIGDMLARGDAELGFQQVTELMHGNGFQYLGTLPVELQNYTAWSAAAHTSAPQVDAASAFIRALKAPEAGEPIRKSGMEPL